MANQRTILSASGVPGNRQWLSGWPNTDCNGRINPTLKTPQNQRRVCQVAKRIMPTQKNQHSFEVKRQIRGKDKYKNYNRLYQGWWTLEQLHERNTVKPRQNKPITHFMTTKKLLTYFIYCTATIRTSKWSPIQNISHLHTHQNLFLKKNYNYTLYMRIYEILTAKWLGLKVKRRLIKIVPGML